MFVSTSRFLSTFVFLALCSALVLAAHEHNPGRRHHAVNLTERDTHLGKRFDNARFTYFEVGTNACGGFDHENDFIVALNAPQWDGGSHCFAAITVSYQGKSANAKITDECAGCPPDAIDLSPGLFRYLMGSTDAGQVYGSWVFGSGEEPQPSPKPSPKPTSTHEAPPPPPSSTSTSTSTSTSKTEQEKPTTTPSSSTTHSATSSHVSSSSATSTHSSATPTSAAPAATVTTFDNGMLNQVNLAMLQLAGIVLAAPGSA